MFISLLWSPTAKCSGPRSPAAWKNPARGCRIDDVDPRKIPLFCSHWPTIKTAWRKAGKIGRSKRRSSLATLCQTAKQSEITIDKVQDIVAGYNFNTESHETSCLRYTFVLTINTNSFRYVSFLFNSQS